MPEELRIGWDNIKQNGRYVWMKFSVEERNLEKLKNNILKIQLFSANKGEDK